MQFCINVKFKQLSVPFWIEVCAGYIIYLTRKILFKVKCCLYILFQIIMATEHDLSA